MSSFLHTLAEIRQRPLLASFLILLLLIEVAVTVFFWNFAAIAGAMWLALFIPADLVILLVACVVFSR